MQNIESLTEQRNPSSYNLDCLSPPEIIKLMNQEDYKVVQAVSEQNENIAKTVEMVVNSLTNNGTLFYIGAGTSGRLGILDSVECPPTFSTDPDIVQGIIAGGHEAFVKAVEGAEDSAENGANDIKERVKKNDVVIGIATSGSTPYVRGALKEAKKTGAKTALITCTKLHEDDPSIDILITPLVGPEILTGSTRLKAGTATKMILNMISTITMIKLGKVYENLMIDLKVVNKKLKKRALKIIKTLTNVDDETAQNLLEQAKGKVKPALVMYFLKVNYEIAEQRLKESNGFLRPLLK